LVSRREWVTGAALAPQLAARQMVRLPQKYGSPRLASRDASARFSIRWTGYRISSCRRFKIPIRGSIQVRPQLSGAGPLPSMIFGPTLWSGGNPMKSVDTISSVLSLKGRQLWSVAPTATVYEAIEKMSEKGVGALLVLSEGKLAGIISERDYARKVILKDRSSKQTLVREIMGASVITVTGSHYVEECMRIMTENRIRHLPVMDRDQVVGIVSIGDLVNWIITAHEETIGHLQSYIAGNYPG